MIHPRSSGRQESQTLKRSPTLALPTHFTPLCLWHSFASLLLAKGETPQWIQRQLGHSSIQLTVDTYEA